MGTGGAPPQEQREKELLALNMKQRASLPTDFCNICLAVSLFYLSIFSEGKFITGVFVSFFNLKMNNRSLAVILRNQKSTVLWPP